jgi:S-(hydroxymethyl)glutathione dehydrogenase/alcohol dehydrogenase
MPRLVEFYNQRRLHLDDWISDRITLTDINAGFANMKSGKVVRSVIQFDA